MTSGKYVVDSIRGFEYMDKQLGRLRQWLEGFRQGGGEIPHDVDVLRQCQIALSSGRPLRTPTDARELLRDLTRALDDLENCVDAARMKLSKVEGIFAEAASVDTHAERGDAKQAPSARMGSAVAKPDAHNQ